jgi:hypothetical protein
LARQHLGDRAHHVAHGAFKLQFAFDVVFGQGAHLAGLEEGNAGPVGKRQLDAGVDGTQKLAVGQLQCDVCRQLRRAQCNVGNLVPDHGRTPFGGCF